MTLKLENQLRAYIMDLQEENHMLRVGLERYRKLAKELRDFIGS